MTDQELLALCDRLRNLPPYGEETLGQIQDIVLVCKALKRLLQERATTHHSDDEEIQRRSDLAKSSHKLLEAVAAELPKDAKYSWGLQEVMLRLRIDIATPGVRESLHELMEPDERATTLQGDADDDRTIEQKTAEVRQPFERYPELAGRIAYLASKMRGISLVTWDGFLATLNAALEEAPTSLPQEPVGPVWRTMESAPKDGSSFIACSGNWITVCHWHRNAGAWCCVSPSYELYPSDEQPTHWQPLPAAPAPKESV